MDEPIRVELSAEDRRRARRRAAEEGWTVAEYVRGLILDDLAGWTPKPDEPVVIEIEDGTDAEAEPLSRPDASIGEAVAARLDKAAQAPEE